MTFKTTIALFDEYYRLADAKNVPDFNRDLGCEVRERLLQLEYIVDRVRQLEGIAKQVMARQEAAHWAHLDDIKARGIDYESVPLPDNVKLTKEEMDAHSKAAFELKLLSEAFYYFAGRVRTILKKTGLPGLQGFECKGVRDVRNKLLEHAGEKQSEVVIQSFGWGAPQGPVLKAVRYGGQEDVFPDAGLYRNAEEFIQNLDRRLRAAMSSF
jgi:hypothetical protein